MMQRIGRWFGRKPTTRWTIYEASALERLQVSVEQLDAIEVYYTARIAKQDDYRRRDLQTLLNNWAGEEDRARAWLAKSGKQSPAQTQAREERKQSKSEAEEKAAQELAEACAEADRRLNGSRDAFAAWLRDKMPLAADQFERAGHVTPTVLAYVAQWEGR